MRGVRVVCRWSFCWQRKGFNQPWRLEEAHHRERERIRKKNGVCLYFFFFLERGSDYHERLWITIEFP
ncbi:hypothetical protein HanRHA438_Chr15g0691941 [Helianthus annuus]|nr:hypothetical protein HanRHA438_Chr15g0691941 [Helianthus annuus]